MNVQNKLQMLCFDYEKNPWKATIGHHKYQYLAYGNYFCQW